MQLLIYSCGGIRRFQPVFLVEPLSSGFSLNCLSAICLRLFHALWSSLLGSCSSGPMPIHLSTSELLDMNSSYQYMFLAASNHTVLRPVLTSVFTGVHPESQLFNFLRTPSWSLLQLWGRKLIVVLHYCGTLQLEEIWRNSSLYVYVIIVLFAYSIL